MYTWFMATHIHTEGVNMTSREIHSIRGYPTDLARQRLGLDDVLQTGDTGLEDGLERHHPDVGVVCEAHRVDRELRVLGDLECPEQEGRVDEQRAGERVRGRTTVESGVKLTCLRRAGRRRLCGRNRS